MNDKDYYLMIETSTGKNRTLTVDEFEHRYGLDTKSLLRAIETGETLYDNNGNAFYVDEAL